ncbi:hypothetical protein D3C79_544070 [compost metagenome]
MIDDKAHGLPHLADVAKLIKALFITWMARVFNVIAHQAQVGAVPVRHPAAGTWVVIDIDQVGVGFGSAPAFEDLNRAEAFNPTLPRLGGQAGAQHATQAVLVLVGCHGLVEQVAADFADVLEHADTVLAYILPELAHAELAPYHDAGPGTQCG